VLVEGPATEAGKGVPRQSVPIAHVSLTPIVMKIPRAIGPGPLAAKWKDQGIEKTWKESAFSLGRERSAKRRALNDFERFKVLRLRKQVC
jgi:large subunit ribosomal protein L14e